MPLSRCSARFAVVAWLLPVVAAAQTATSQPVAAPPGSELPAIAELPTRPAEAPVITYSYVGAFGVDAGGSRWNQGGLRYARHRLDAALPLGQGPDTVWRAILRIDGHDIDTDLRFPRTWEAFPGELWDLRAGLGYRTRLENGWDLDVEGELGSASDEPFRSFDELIYQVNAFVRIPASDTTAWLLMLNVSNTRNFVPNVPLPGVGWEVRPDPSFEALLGVPFSRFRWEPLENVTLEGRYFLPRGVFTRVGWRPAPPLELYAGFEWASEMWFRAARRDDDDRLFFDHKEVLAGLRWDIDEHVSLDVGAGYGFDRFFYEGEDYDDRGDRRINLADGPLMKVQLRASF